MTMIRRSLLIGAAAITAGLMTSVAYAADTVRIGSVLSITGPASFLGDPEKKTLEMYVRDLNAAGGVNGKKLELFIYDDGGDSNKARTFATRLVEEDKVDAVIAGSITGTSIAMRSVFEDAQTPYISLAGAAEIVTPVRKWVFKMPHTEPMSCGKIFEDLKKRKLTTIAMISGTDGWGKAMRAECVAMAPKEGIKVVKDEIYGAADSDMTPQLINIKNTPGVQAVINCGFGQGPAIVTRNYRQVGITVPLYQSHGVSSKSFINLAGPAANGIRLPAAALLVATQLADSDPLKKVALDYKTKFEKETGQPVSTFGGHARDALFMLIEAMKRAGSADKAKVRDEIEKTKGFIGTGGVINMSPTDHLGLDLTSFRMIEIKDGDWQLVQ
ncbi:MAG: ABC transporter substrate-binding protein [Pseudorhodoplanes sp.]|nr:Leucine-, isoleucine-, valine-, threonine-, and alanine-binding protein [Pseudorhodoplanes sp.]MBW7947854.1 ABC transporter substrate-binding protein [Pseudorhodoplanes sp.]MCL4709637.1 ABC transporter substrate-binding protein [Pseudorhodoplanes sp.]